MTRFLFAFCLLVSSCSATHYYVVRHAEKSPSSTMTTDVPLSDQGSQRALALAAQLKNANIKYIFTTDFKRTRGTVQPLADNLGIQPQVYDPRDRDFATKLSALKGNVLVVGHSNTVDDLVNQLSGQTLLPGDLPDDAFGDLFVLTRKGKKWKFEKKHFGFSTLLSPH